MTGYFGKKEASDKEIKEKKERGKLPRTSMRHRQDEEQSASMREDAE